MNTTLREKHIEPFCFAQLTRVVSKNKLIKIPLQMPSGNKVIDTRYSSLQQTPKSLYSVGMDTAIDVLAKAMLNDTMVVNPAYCIVAKPFVSKNRCAFFDVKYDFSSKCTALYVFYFLCDHVSPPLYHPNHRSLVFSAPSL